MIGMDKRVGQLVQVAEGLWLVDGPVVRWFTMPFPTRMVICRLASGELFIHSPVALTPEMERALSDLGEPRHLVSPNKLHHLFIAEWQERFPGIRVYASPGLGPKRPDLHFDGELTDEPEKAWAQDIDQFIFQGSRLLDEVVFFHKASRTLILGDLVENFDSGSLSWFHRMLARFGRVLAPNGQTPIDYRQSFRGNYDQARESYRRIRQWEPQAVVMCHGVPVLENAGPFLDRAFAWLH